eukprot:Skav209308  [mRNA]  locus=scaffold994:321728:325834:+ [translate_table: standard]
MVSLHTLPCPLDLGRSWQQAAVGQALNGQAMNMVMSKDNIGLAVGEVVAITGCRSDQTSADVHNVHAPRRYEDFQVQPSGRRASLQLGRRRSMPNTAAGGALTTVFMEIRGRLEEEEYDQVPQLATSLLIELKSLGQAMRVHGGWPLPGVYPSVAGKIK